MHSLPVRDFGGHRCCNVFESFGKSDNAMRQNIRSENLFGKSLV